MKKLLLNSKIVLALVFLALGYGNAFSQTPTPNWHLVPENPNFPKTERVVAGFTVDPATWGNGAMDATDDIQAMLLALDRAGNRGQMMWHNQELLGGGVLYMPAGMYRIDGQLIIPKGVTIRGDWRRPVKGQPIEGTIIRTNHGRGISRAMGVETYENSAFIIMQSASAIMDVAIWYPDQDPNNIVPYSPTILIGHRGGPHGNEFNNIRNVTLVNSYDGVIFSQIGGTCYVINGLFGTPLNIGIEIDRIVDIGRAEHISFSPMYWAYSGLPGSPNINNAAFRNHLYENAVGVIMRRNDWSYTLYLEVEGYNKGFWAAVSLQDDGVGGVLATPNGHNYGFTFRNNRYGVFFESSTGQGSVLFAELLMEGVEFGIYVSSIAAGVTQFYRANISATRAAIYSDPESSANIALIESNIRAGKVLMQGGTLLATNNDFNNPAPQIEFEANSRGAVIGNRFSQGVEIVENSIFENVIDHTPVDMRPLPPFIFHEPRVTKMQGNAFAVVTTAPRGHKDNVAANPTVADATAAIQEYLNSVAAQGGGIVFLPPGHYRIDGQLVIPAGVELRGSTDVSSFPVGPGSVLAIYNTQDVAVIMEGGSGMRGINFNYPTQVFCTVMPNPIDFPFTIQGRGDNIYIVNVAMRASNRGIDLFTYSNNYFYINFLTGYFFREGVNIRNSRNGVLANMQCNTIVYNNGDEVKFGQFPLSNRHTECADNAALCPYYFNSINMDFLILEDVENIFLYNNFNYNARVGLLVRSNVSGTALGFALDDDRIALLLDGDNINLDFINLQCVALYRGPGGVVNDPAGGSPASYIVSTSNFANGEVNIFNSAWWGHLNGHGIVKNGSGTINLYGAFFQDSGTGPNSSFAEINDGTLNIIASVVNPPRNSSNPTLINNGGSANISGSVIDGNGRVPGDTNLGHSPTNSNSGVLNDCDNWTATATFSAEGTNPQNILCDNNLGWTSGWQNQETGQGAVAITIDMQSNQIFNQIILEYTSAPNDGPETYTVEVSTNGTSWTQVAAGSGRNPAMTMIAFETQNARFIRFTKPPSNTANFWRIDNLFVTYIRVTNVDDLPLIPDGTPPIGSDTTDPVAVTGVTMANVTVLVGNTAALAPMVEPFNATDRSVSFELLTNPGNVISLNTANGQVEGLAAGTATVQVTTTDGGFTAVATVTVTIPSECDPIRIIRIQSYSDGTRPAVFLTDNGGTLAWTTTANDNSAWYEIPVEGTTNDFYYKNVATGNYIHRPGLQTTVVGDWGHELAALSNINPQTALFQFRQMTSTWGGRYWLVNVADADFDRVTAGGAFILNAGNYNHNIPYWNNGNAVIIGGIPSNTNVWTSSALVVVNPAVDNPDCGVIVNIPPLAKPEFEVILYPNPTTGMVYLSQHAEVRIYSLQGVLLQVVSGTQVDLSAQRPGMYIAVVTFGGQTRHVKLIRK